jgi:hypothetical protein
MTWCQKTKKSNYFLIGKMADHDEPDFNEQYEAIRSRVFGNAQELKG